MPVTDQWYIAIDPSKTEVKEVPSDLRGLDRIEYASYAELGNKLSLLMEQRYPRRKRSGIEEFLGERRTQVKDILRDLPGYTITSLVQLLVVYVPGALFIVSPMMDDR